MSWALPPLHTPTSGSPVRCSLLPPLYLQPHPNWSRLPYMVTAGPPAPGRSPPTPTPPHRTRSPPCSPSVVCLCPAMEDLGEWGPSSLVPISSLSPGPTSPYWTPSQSLHLPIPVSSRLTPGLSARAFFPTPCPPSCLSLPAFPQPAAPSLLPSLCSSVTAVDR